MFLVVLENSVARAGGKERELTDAVESEVYVLGQLDEKYTEALGLMLEANAQTDSARFSIERMNLLLVERLQAFAQSTKKSEKAVEFAREKLKYMRRKYEKMSSGLFNVDTLVLQVEKTLKDLSKN